MYIAFEILTVEHILTSLHPTKQTLLRTWLCMCSRDNEQYYFADDELLFLQKHISQDANALAAKRLRCEPEQPENSIHAKDLTRLYGQQSIQKKQTWLNTSSQTLSPIS